MFRFVYLLFGGQRAGKTTLAATLSERWRVPRIELRGVASTVASSAVGDGNSTLVLADVDANTTALSLVRLLQTKTDDWPNGVIVECCNEHVLDVDGATCLDALCTKQSRWRIIAIYLAVSPAVAMARLESCSGATRMVRYDETARALSKYYKTSQRLAQFDGAVELADLVAAVERSVTAHKEAASDRADMASNNDESGGDFVFIPATTAATATGAAENLASKTLVIALSGFGQQLQMPTFEFFGYLRRASDADKLFIRDSKCLFLLDGMARKRKHSCQNTAGGSIYEFVDLIDGIIDERRPTDILMIGTCGGGHSCFLLAALLQKRGRVVDRIVVFSPVTLLNPSLFFGHGAHVNESVQRAARLQSAVDFLDARPFVLELCQKKLTHIDVHYGQSNVMDSWHVALLPPPDEFVRIHCHRTPQHSIARYLRDRCELADALDVSSSMSSRTAISAISVPSLVLYAAQRSGHHAIVCWLIANCLPRGVAWFRHVKSPDYSSHRNLWRPEKLVCASDSRLDYRVASKLLMSHQQYFARDWKCVVTTLEDQVPVAAALRNDPRAITVVVVRDFYNNAASRAAQRPYAPNPIPLPNKMTSNFVELWVEHAQIACGLHVVCAAARPFVIFYDLWCVSSKYRRRLALSFRSLFGVVDDAYSDVLPLSPFGGGSSFIGVRLESDASEYLMRWSRSSNAARAAIDASASADVVRLSLYLLGRRRLELADGKSSDESIVTSLALLPRCHFCGRGARHACAFTVRCGPITRQRYQTELLPYYAAHPVPEFLLHDVRGTSFVMRDLLVADEKLRRFVMVFADEKFDWLVYPDLKDSWWQAPSRAEMVPEHFVAWLIDDTLRRDAWWRSAIARFDDIALAPLQTSDPRLLRFSLCDKASSTNYLHSLADLSDDTHLPLLQRAFARITERLHSFRPSGPQYEAFVHFPVSPLYSTLHLHFGMSERFLCKEQHAVGAGRSVRLDDVIRLLSSGEDVLVSDNKPQSQLVPSSSSSSSSSQCLFNAPICALEDVATLLSPSSRAYLSSPSLSPSRLLQPQTIAMFDCHGTLVAGQVATVQASVVRMLRQLRASGVIVILVSGAPFAMLDRIFRGDSLALFDVVCAENGLDSHTRASRYTLPLCESLSDDQLTSFIQFVNQHIAALPLPYDIENLSTSCVDKRVSMLNVSFIGKPADEKLERMAENFAAWDRAHSARAQLINALRERFPRIGFSYAIGASFNFDCVLHAKDYALRFFRPGIDKIVFFGDRCEPGGNDHELWRRCRPHSVCVNSVDDTILHVRRMFALPRLPTL